jgi:hypothetical protein
MKLVKQEILVSGCFAEERKQSEAEHLFREEAVFN